MRGGAINDLDTWVSVGTYEAESAPIFLFFSCFR